jgi:dihydrofolate reductase
VTRTIDAIAPDPANPRATLWNPAGASFEAACERAGVTRGTVAIIGGPSVFAMFMKQYDTFWLSQAPHVYLAGGEPCFPGVPEQSPQQILAANGLKAGEVQMLDGAHDVSVTPWRRTL